MRIPCYRCGRDVQQILWKEYGGFCISCFELLAQLSRDKIAANNEACRRECQVEQAKIDAYNDMHGVDEEDTDMIEF